MIEGIEYRLLDSSAGDELAFKDLHNKIFKNTSMSLEWKRWYTSRIEYNNSTRIYGAFHDGRMIGSWCVEPKTLINDDAEGLRVGRCFAVGIDEDYRRNNLFVNLSKAAIDYERSLGVFDYIVGFPQIGRPVISGHLKAGWEHVQDIQVKSAVPDGEHKRVSLHDVAIVRDFYAAQGMHTGVSVGGFFEDAAYKQFRFINHPDNHYVCMCNRPGSTIVLKMYRDVCHILDINGTTDDVCTLLTAAKTLAYRHRMREINAWCADNEKYVDEFVSCGFKPGAESALPVSMLAVRITADKRLSLKSVHLQMGVEECY